MLQFASAILDIHCLLWLWRHAVIDDDLCHDSAA